MSDLASGSDAQDRFKLRHVAFFGRTLAEYLRMFALDLDELRGLKILDVASGPGSFVAEALALGLDVTGCDPMYAQDAATISAQGQADVDACREQIRNNPGVLVYRDVEEFYRQKHTALERFAADFTTRCNEGRYVVGALPALPFEDGAFDLVVSANFLMIHAPLADGGMHDGNEFDLAFHRRAFRELARVTRRVRERGSRRGATPLGPPKNISRRAYEPAPSAPGVLPANPPPSPRRRATPARGLSQTAPARPTRPSFRTFP